MADRVEHDDDDDDDRNSSADSDFFSPISASFFRPKPAGGAPTSSMMMANNKHSSQHTSQQQGSGEKLPPLHDSSWIGARLSPIGQSFDNESLDDNNENDDDDDDDDDAFPTAPRRHHESRSRAQHESLSLFEGADFIIGSSVPPPQRATERTRLLSSRPASSSSAAVASGAGVASAAAATATNRGDRLGDGGPRTLPFRVVPNNHHHQYYSNDGRAGGGGLRIGTAAIHPLWNQPPESSQTAKGVPSAHSPRKLPISWGGLVCTASGLAFCLMAVYDYLESSTKLTEESDVGLTYNATGSVSRQWSTPWLRPSYATMYEFGAFAPQLDWEYPLRMVASSFLCSSVAEYLVVLVAWRIISRIRQLAADDEPWHHWFGMYAASCVAGQLWMTAWDRTNGALTGCVAWSTCGVLTYAGMQALSRRLVCFGTAALLLLLSLLQRPGSSVVGTVGACSLGWALAAAEVTSVPYWPPPPSQLQQRRSYHDKIAAHNKPSWLCWIGRVLAVKIVVLPTLFISFLY